MTLAYPVADVVMVALLVGVFAVTDWRPGRAWTALAIGLLLNSVADVVYTWQTSAGSAADGTWIDALWVVAALTMATAAWQPGGETTRLRMQGWRSIAAPLGFGALLLVLLASDLVHEIGPVASGLALLALAAVLIRTGLTFRENLALAASRRLAATDELTGLANRRGFYALADAALARAHAAHLPTALLLLDLDRFKELNDTLGHHVGDELLIRFAERLKHAIPQAQVLGRLGGDEFVLLLPAGEGAPEALEAADRVNAMLEEPVALASAQAGIGSSASAPYAAWTASSSSEFSGARSSGSASSSVRARMRARSSSSASSGSRATLNWASPDWRVPSISPSPRSSRSISASLKPSRCSPSARRRGDSFGPNSTHTDGCSPRPMRPRSWCSCEMP